MQACILFAVVLHVLCPLITSLPCRASSPRGGSGSRHDWRCDARRSGDLPVSFTATLDGKVPGNHSASHRLVQKMVTSLLSPTRYRLKEMLEVASSAIRYYSRLSCRIVLHSNS
ncbi:hypothetical protein IG631_09430 [Alternaria alternata]|nr:hypothetical protein IG631_09430 [Alternaria alternata]